MRTLGEEETKAGRVSAMPPSGGHKTLGRYELLDEIGRGGMACVYLARFSGIEGFERTVVVKAMRSALLNNPEITEMFRAEAILSAQLTHPNIVRVHDFGMCKDVPFLVMEHLDGWDLERVWTKQRGRGRTLPIDSAVFIAREVAEALAYAHEFQTEKGEHRPVVHRDVSPANVMISKDGSIRLLDFGIAKVKTGLSKATGQVLRGKYSYLAPEQVNFAATDHRVDIFSAGIVLWEMLTGQLAFKCKNDVDTLDRIADAKIDPPSKYNKQVSATLDRIVLRALAKDPGQRFGTARELADALTAESAGSSFSLATHLSLLFGEAAPSEDDDDNLKTLRAVPLHRATPFPSRGIAALSAPTSARPPKTATPRASTLAMSSVSDAAGQAGKPAGKKARVMKAQAPAEELSAPPPAEPSFVMAAALRPPPKPTRWLGVVALLDLVAVLAALWWCPNPRVQVYVQRAQPYVAHVVAAIQPQLDRAIAFVRINGAARIEPLFPMDYELPPITVAALQR